MKHAAVIVGAGPAGLMLACELGLAGVDAAVIERADEPNSVERSRAHTLHARAVELLDQRGLLDELIDDETPVWPMIHYANFWLNLSTLLDHEYSLLVPQARTEHVLERRATELGITIRRGTEVVGLSQDDDGVTLAVRTVDGEESLRARYVVGCDGENSAVRDLAGFQAPTSGPTWSGVLADFDDLAAEWQSPSYPGGILAVVPHPSREGWVRLMAMEFDAETPPDGTPVTVDELRMRAARIAGKKWLIGEPKWLYRYVNTTRLADSYRNGRVFLAGDAAHVHYFGAGHGATTSLHDAANLGWKLGAEINGWAPPGLLDTYHEERHPVGRRVCMSTEAQLLLQHPPERVGPLRELFGELVKFEDVNRHLAEIVTKVSYPMAGDPHPLLGRRIPQISLEGPTGEFKLAATLRAGRGVLLDLSDGSGRLNDLAGWSGQVDMVPAKPTPELGTALLIRPDGYIAWAGEDADSLHNALTRWFGQPR